MQDGKLECTVQPTLISNTDLGVGDKKTNEAHFLLLRNSFCVMGGVVEGRIKSAYRSFQHNVVLYHNVIGTINVGREKRNRWGQGKIPVRGENSGKMGTS